jgi:hypothetical protein
MNCEVLVWVQDGVSLTFERRGWVKYLFCVGGQYLALAAAGDLADEDVEHFLAEDVLAFAFEDVAGVFLDGGLA